jgi:chromate transporter
MNNPTPAPEPKKVSLREALPFWFKLGFISFGGPAGQIAIMHRELVEQKRWISEKRFLHALNYCMVLPGPEAQQLATYIGWLMHRTLGGVIAGLLFVLPSLFIMIALSWIYMAYGNIPVVAGLFYGIKAAVAAIVVQAVHRIGTRALKNSLLWMIAALSFIGIHHFHLHYPAIVASAALLGYLGGKVAPGHFTVSSGHGAANPPLGPAIIDDNTPTPLHAIFSWNRFRWLVILGIIFWWAPMLVLVTVFGWDYTLAQMGWFFSKAALLTFGGAYAVLPYVYQGAVEHYHWLTSEQMIDGLGLGETTPGPLIMVVAFVGFIGAYTQHLFGEHLFLAGAAAATLVTWFTFLPSFFFILMGGPLVETTHDNLKFTAPLTAITAAVVGVMLNLALFFAHHVLWPDSHGHRFDYAAATLALGAAVALFKYKRSVMEVIAVCAVLGLLLKLAGI